MATMNARLLMQLGLIAVASVPFVFIARGILQWKGGSALAIATACWVALSVGNIYTSALKASIEGTTTAAANLGGGTLGLAVIATLGCVGAALALWRRATSSVSTRPVPAHVGFVGYFAGIMLPLAVSVATGS